ncbi:hypothetical protein D3C81_2033940 [compost metagenome]
MHFLSSFAPFHKQQQTRGKCGQHQCYTARSRYIEVLDVLIDQRGRGLGFVHDIARNDQHRPEFPQRARNRQNYTVDHSPADGGPGYLPEGGPAIRT